MRIIPRELHIKDPYYYDEVYAPSSEKREKDPNFVSCFGMPSAMVSTVGHDLHRFRRGLMSNLFSKRSVLELSPILHEKNSKLMQRFERAYVEERVLELSDAFVAFTADLFSQYSRGVSSGFLDHDNFNNEFRHAVHEMTSLVHVLRFFPILVVIQSSMPRWLLRKLRPKMSSIHDMQALVAHQSTPQNMKPAKTSTKTIFEALSDPSVVPPEERSPRRLADEGLSVIIGGTEITTLALTFAAFYLYQSQNKSLIMKLRQELRSVMPTPTTEASWTQLEQLPYLVRLRLSIRPSPPRAQPSPIQSKPNQKLTCLFFAYIRGES